MTWAQSSNSGRVDKMFTQVAISALKSDQDKTVQLSSVQSLSCVQLFVTPWTAACQASLSITNSQSLLKPMSIESVMPSNHLILCRPLLLLPSIPPSIRVFSHESALHSRWPKYWSFSFNTSPFIEYSGLISFWIDRCVGWASLERPYRPPVKSPQCWCRGRRTASG